MYNKTISEQLTEIMKLCYQINNVETNREKTGNLPTVFANFYGHTCQLDVSIYDEGWTTPHDKEPWQSSAYLDKEDATTILILDKIIDRLNVTLKTKARKEKKQNV